MNYPERIVPGEAEPGVDALHLKRYEFVERWCDGCDVLDAACGVGYGSAFLGRAARTVLGIDVSADAVAHARTHFARENVSFEEMDVLELQCADASFDVVCFFEAIEHVEDPERALTEIARVLQDDGVLALSTPQVAETTTSPANPFHRIEFSRPDLERLLERHFATVEMWGQRRLQTRRHRLAQRLDVLGLRRRFALVRRASPVFAGTTPTAALTAADIVISRERVEQASELVAVCRGPRRH